MLNRSVSLAMSTSVLKALSGKLNIKRHSPSGVSTQLQSSGLVAHENSTFRNLAPAVSGPFMA